MDSRQYVGQPIASINNPPPSASTLPPTASSAAVQQQFIVQQQQPLVGAQAVVQPDTVSSNINAPTNGTKKRRISNAGSRGVANLTPEQLAKKRANDREAQRAIRERTKGQIENLEKKIQELTAQKPYLELQKVIRQKEKVEAENEDIKRRLLSVQGLIRPWVASSLNDAAPPSHLPTPNLPPLHTANDTRSSQMQAFPLPNTPYSDIPSMRSSASNPSYIASSPIQKQGMPMPPSNFPPTPSAFSSTNASNSRHGSGQSLTSNRPPDDKLALEYLMQSRHNSGDSDQLGTGRGRAISSSNPILPMDTMNACTYGNAILDIQGNPLPVCALPIRNTPPSCPLDGLLLDFLADQKKQAINGVSLQELIGPNYPSFLSLVTPQRNQYSHPLSKVFVDMIVTFPDISTLPEQVAILYIMFLIMRYCIAPTPENYDRLPSWATPRPSQLFHPHPCWIDYLPFPRMRDKLTRSYPSIPFDEFFVPYTTTVSLNWPYPDSQVLVPISGGVGGGGEELGLSAAFEEHLRDLGNWTLGPQFVKAHPSLAGTMKVREGGERKGRRKRES